jgi:hypothetical protein
MKQYSSIETIDDWETRRIVEVVNQVHGCKGEIRPEAGDKDRRCELVLFCEDEAAVSRMLKALEPLIKESDDFHQILDSYRALPPEHKNN